MDTDRVRGDLHASQFNSVLQSIERLQISDFLPAALSIIYCGTPSLTRYPQMTERFCRSITKGQQLCLL